VRHALQQVQALFEQAALAQQPRIQEPLELVPAPVQTPAAPQRLQLLRDVNRPHHAARKECDESTEPRHDAAAV
jgi:hypothetical protein